MKQECYLNQLIRNIWNSEINAITGMHCCGKWVLLLGVLYGYLWNNDMEKYQIIRRELDRRRYCQYRNPILFCKYVGSM